jgi:hypothetical protein
MFQQAEITFCNYTLWTRTLHDISCKHTVRQGRRPAIQNYTEQDSVTFELIASTAKRREAQLLADKPIQVSNEVAFTLQQQPRHCPRHGAAALTPSLCR